MMPAKKKPARRTAPKRRVANPFPSPGRKRMFKKASALA